MVMHGERMSLYNFAIVYRWRAIGGCFADELVWLLLGCKSKCSVVYQYRTWVLLWRANGGCILG